MAADQPTVIDEAAAPAAAPEAAPEPAATKEEQYIQILPGDTIEAFAEKYGTTPAAILERNQLSPADFRFGYWVFV